MELLIPGLILVALMIYASTKIKKSAAQAYKAEFIDGDGFSITKPEGFIYPLNGDSPFSLEAYTKEFGNPPNERLRRASVELRVFKGADVKEVVDIVRSSAVLVVSERKSLENGSVHVLETEETTDKSDVSAFHKIVDGDTRVFHLRAWVLREHKDEFSGRIEEMLESFTVK